MRATREPGEIAVAEEEKLKLGKGAAFVKSRLKRLSQRRRDLGGRLPGAAQADRRRPRRTTWGWSSRREDGSLLAESHVHGRPSVNDLATILANAMRRPLDGNARRPRLVRLRGHHQWRELFPVLEELGVEVSVERDLPGIEEAYRGPPAAGAGRAAGRDGQAIRRAGEGRGDVPGHRPVRRGLRLHRDRRPGGLRVRRPGDRTTAGSTSRTTGPTRWPRRWPPWRRAWPAGSRSRASNSTEWSRLRRRGRT